MLRGGSRVCHSILRHALTANAAIRPPVALIGGSSVVQSRATGQECHLSTRAHKSSSKRPCSASALPRVSLSTPQTRLRHGSSEPKAILTEKRDDALSAPEEEDDAAADVGFMDEEDDLSAEDKFLDEEDADQYEEEEEDEGEDLEERYEDDTPADATTSPAASSSPRSPSSYPDWFHEGSYSFNPKNKRNPDGYPVSLDESHLREKYAKGGGPGGQAVNKATNRCDLTHVPTGIIVRCHEHRTLEQNRKEARRRLRLMLDERLRGRDSVVGAKREKERKRKVEKKKKRVKQQRDPAWEEERKEKREKRKQKRREEKEKQEARERRRQEDEEVR